MKIILFNPPFLPKYSRSSRSPAVTKSSTIYYPLWLSHAAGYLEKFSNDVKLFDAPAEGKELTEYVDAFTAFNPDVFVLDTSTPSIESDIDVANAIRKILPSVSIVLVGPHPSALPDETFILSNEIDIIARREYDETLRDLCDNLRNLSSVKGISFRQGSKIVHNPDRHVIDNLDEIPFVSITYKNHLDIKNYFYAHCQNPVISIFAGRGCPNKCFYCVYPQVMFGQKYRHRSPQHFVEELEYIAREFPEVKEVLIDDDNFSADQEFVAKICDEIVRRKLSVTWTCEARVNLQYDIMIKMKAAGCRLLVAGFESGDQRVLNKINKGTTLAQGEDFTRSARKAGLRVHGCFMIGNRGESLETLKRTLDFALKLHLDTAQFFPLMVYPGTEAYQWAEKNGYIRAENFRQWLTKEGMHNCVLHTKDLSANELVDFCDYARRRFYLRPNYVAYKALDVLRNPQEIARTMKAATTLFAHLFKRHR